MQQTCSTSTEKRICRKCMGPCPPCRPWRCKFGKARTLEECENDLQKTLNQPTLKRFNSAPTMVYANSSKKESQNSIEKAFADLNIQNNASSSSGSIPPGFTRTSASNDETWSNTASSNATSTGTNSPLISHYTHRQILPFPTQPTEPETSHIFLAIAADRALVEYSKMVQKNIINMPEIPEITSLGDSRCIWPHTVHLTIHSFGKVLNVDIPRVVDYCKKKHRGD